MYKVSINSFQSWAEKQNWLLIYAIDETEETCERLTYLLANGEVRNIYTEDDLVEDVRKSEQ